MDIDYFRKKLENEKQRLESEIKYYSTEDPYTNSNRSRGVLDDDITEIEEHDRLDATKTELQKALIQTTQALKRIDNGTYGKCTNCGNQISPERLEIMPAASLCLACQQKKVRA